MSLLTSILVLLSVSLLLKALHYLLWLPHQIQLHFRHQGIVGPPRRLLSGGNAGEIRRLFAAAQSSPTQGLCHDVADRAAPHYARLSARYGRSFLYWFGSQPRLAIGDPTVLRAAMTDTSGTIDKPRLFTGGRDLFGEGLVGLTGEKWARHRRLVGPAFSMERVKVRFHLREEAMQFLACNLEKNDKKFKASLKCDFFFLWGVYIYTTQFLCICMYTI